MHLFQRIGALTLSLVVLLSAMSFHLDMHFCGDTLVSLTFMEEVQGCGMESKDHAAVGSCDEMLAGSDCCSEAQFFFDGQEQVKKTAHKFSQEHEVYFGSNLPNWEKNYSGIIPTRLPYLEYDPPFLIQDHLVLYETFLI